MSTFFTTVEPITEEEHREVQRLTREALALRDSFDLEGEEAAKAEQAHNDAWARVNEADPCSFRVNSVGRWAVVENMSRLGMIDWDAQAPELPRPQDFGLQQYPLSEDEREEGETLTPAEEAFLAALRKVRCMEDVVGPIPGYKLSDDGWRITPREVRAALSRYDKASEADVRTAREEVPFWDRWIRFLRGVPERGGMILC